MILFLLLFPYSSLADNAVMLDSCPKFFFGECPGWCFALNNYTLHYRQHVYNTGRYYFILNNINYSVGAFVFFVAILKIRRIIINANINEQKLEKLRQRRISTHFINIAKEMKKDVNEKHVHELPDSMRDIEETKEKDYIALIEKGGDLEKYAEHFTKQWKQDVSDARSSKFKKMKVKLVTPTDAAFAQSAEDKNVNLQTVFYNPAQNVEIVYDMNFDTGEESAASVATEKTRSRTVKTKSKKKQ